jgi:hypothetical protein
MSHYSGAHMKMMRLTQAVKRLQAKLDIFESSLGIEEPKDLERGIKKLTKLFSRPS